MFSFRNSNSACGPVGIDCGSDALRLLQLRTVAGGTITSHLEVSVAREQPLAPLARRDSGAAWIRAAEEAAEGWRTARFRSSRFVLSLPAPRTQFQIVSLPSLARADFERASQWEASDRFGMDHGDLCATALPTNAPATTDGKGEWTVCSNSLDQESRSIVSFNILVQYSRSIVWANSLAQY